MESYTNLNVKHKEAIIPKNKKKAYKYYIIAYKSLNFQKRKLTSQRKSKWISLYMMQCIIQNKTNKHINHSKTTFKKNTWDLILRFWHGWDKPFLICHDS